VRSSSKGSSWAERGAEVAVADSLDTPALAQAFRAVAGVFVMTPPEFAPSPGFPESTAIVGAIRSALAEATPPKIVCLSSIWAQHDHGIGLLQKLYVLERELAQLSMSCAFLRPRVRTGRLSKVGMQAEHQEPNAPLANANIVLRAPRSSGRFSNSHTDALEDRPRENKPRRTLRSVCGTKSGALRTAAKRRMCSSPTSTTTA